MILVDSSVWIDYFNGRKTSQTDWLDSALGKAPIVIGDLILAEVLQGFQSDREFSTARDILLRYSLCNDGRTELALESVMNYQAPEEKGRYGAENDRHHDRHLLHTPPDCTTARRQGF